MIVIRDPATVNIITDTDIRSLVELRFTQLCEGSGDGDGSSPDDPYDSEMLGYMVVVEAGDTVDALESECGCPILHNYFEPEIKFGDPDFVHSAELIEEHPSFYEMTYILGGDFGIGIFIPIKDGINPELLAMCRTYAIPASDLTEA